MMFAAAVSAFGRSTRSVFLSLGSRRPVSTSTMAQKESHTVNTTERIGKLRELMKKTENDIEAFVVPSEDQHSSEYLAHCDQRRAFISGFTGSAGCAVVTLNDAYLFTDGRYFLQAGQQLDNNWKLMKQGMKDVPSWQEFLSKNLPDNTRIGIDPTLISASDASTIRTQLNPKSSKLVPIQKNLVDEVWGSDRPARPANPVFPLDEKYSGQGVDEKLEKVREELKKSKHEVLVVNMLDEVAWLFNLRGSDIDYNPVFFAYAVVTLNDVDLFVNKSQLDASAYEYVAKYTRIRPYEAFFDYLKDLPSILNLKAEGEPKIFVGDKASLAIVEALEPHKPHIARSPVTDLKAIKNSVELEGFRQCHIRDGAALARYFAWLEEALNNGETIDEVQGADKLEGFRSELDLFKGLSFDTISSAGANAAIIHYKPDPKDCAVIKKEEIYLCDSGAQFLDGTTDVTRTWHFGTPTDEEKRAFTRVLQGHIAIDDVVFPGGTTGFVIDAFARRALWQDGLDYRHGTGHGVGHFLNVHEGPHGIGVRIAYNSVALKPGMTISNEPGYYADGRFGIRLENIVLVKEVETTGKFGEKGWFGLERVTMCPMHKNLINVNLLTKDELKWVNDYHKEVWEKVSPLLKNDERALRWLERECAALEG